MGEAKVAHNVNGVFFSTNKRLQVSTWRIYCGIIGQESGENMLLILKMET